MLDYEAEQPHLSSSNSLFYTHDFDYLLTDDFLRS